MYLESFECKVDHILGDISVEEFLAHYWQKKPLLIRNAFAGIQSPLTAEELAGLACEENINARLVLEKDGDYPWQAEYGPFDEERFTSLPRSHWSLLVSDVERLLPETKSLVKAFRFLPDWRFDDLMISYAPTGGSVGPHVDDYDVFLIQLNGQRLWQIAEQFPDEILQDVDLRILKQFTAEQEWLCSPGDMLYLPPGIAHHGVAQEHKDQCMTASVGFRAPSIKTITSDYIHYLNENLHGSTRFTDNAPILPKHHAEISDDTVSQFIECLKQGLDLGPEHVKQWLGRYCSDNKAFEEIELEQHEVDFEELTKLATSSTLQHSPWSNFLFSLSGEDALLFVNGESYRVSQPFAKLLCKDDQVDFQQLLEIMTDEDKQVFLYLYNSGTIII
jgi:50S ribosomal protein L16 3-hydroxylase